MIKKYRIDRKGRVLLPAHMRKNLGNPKSVKIRLFDDKLGYLIIEKVDDDGY